jgi:NAD(P)-dependent dehydrogenase (short-subunit alcohol dehydrogenase family)
VAEFGAVDVLINNAGFARFKSPYELTVAEWDDMLNTHLRGMFLCAREAAKPMRDSGRGGAIVNVASTRARMSEPGAEAYAAAKGGIVALTHALAVSLGPDRIRVNCVSPGWIETSSYDALRAVDHAQHPTGRVGKPEDVALACLYLTDPANDFVTGVDLVVDGGMTRKMIYAE